MNKVWVDAGLVKTEEEWLEYVLDGSFEKPYLSICDTIESITKNDSEQGALLVVTD